MLIYLDMFCLKRPFDDQSQPRIRLETEVVLTLLSMESDRLGFVRSAALIPENASNPIPERASRVEKWLSARMPWQTNDPQALEARVAELMDAGLKNFDALHVACAEEAGADWFATTDDRLLAALRRNPGQPHFRVGSVVECAEEISK